MNARLAACWIAILVLSTPGCGTDDRRGAAQGSIKQGTVVKNPALPRTFGFGKEPAAARIAAMNIDVNPTGVSLPAGSGNYAGGATVYVQKCAVCHGAKGQGAGIYPQLIGFEHVRDFSFANDPRIPKTIGNYWPYATTLYDYVHRAMPYTAPGSLDPNEVYSVVAYLLAENRVVSRDAVIDAKTLPRIKMPAHDHFVPDDRKGGASFR
jgi:mono/diheme cytochrome c family protein